MPLALAAVASFFVLGCNLDISLRAEARDQWQRHYTLADGGTLEVRNTNGQIQVEPGDGPGVDVTADRVVRASTDEAAKQALSTFEIRETVSANQITLDSTAQSGGNFLSSPSRRVDYHIRIPRSANVHLGTTNGDIEVTGPRLTGTFRAESTNGRIRASGLENSAHATTTNGVITLQLAKIGDDGVSCETTNGKIQVTVPSDTNARVSARVTNGAIRTEGLSLTVSDQSRRRLDGTIGRGGPTIKLETTNGAIDLLAAR